MNVVKMINFMSVGHKILLFFMKKKTTVTTFSFVGGAVGLFLFHSSFLKV